MGIRANVDPNGHGWTGWAGLTRLDRFCFTKCAYAGSTGTHRSGSVGGGRRRQFQGGRRVSSTVCEKHQLSFSPRAEIARACFLLLGRNRLQIVHPLPQLRGDWAHPGHLCAAIGLTRATSAPGLGSPRPHLRRDWAHPGHICAGTGLTPAISAQLMGSPEPHLHRDSDFALQIDGAAPSVTRRLHGDGDGAC